MKLFNNLNPNCKPKSFKDLLKWKLTVRNPKWPRKILIENYDMPPPIITEPNKIRVTWIGQATFLIQIDGFNILTDPIWSKRASPFKYFGPKRVMDPGIKLNNLPKIDIILISHNHYDHLDLNTIKFIWQRNQPRIITPLMNDAIIKNISVHTLDWQENIIINSSLSIHLEPSQHWSARGLFDRNRALWGNFIIKTKNYDICFIGDSGYSEQLYKDTGAKYNIFLSIIPIGAFEPRWFMRDMHMTPEEAVLTHKDLKSKYSIASHFQTFQLGSESYLQAPTEFNYALEKYQITHNNFILPKCGQAYWFNTNN